MKFEQSHPLADVSSKSSQRPASRCTWHGLALVGEVLVPQMQQAKDPKQPMDSHTNLYT